MAENSTLVKDLNRLLGLNQEQPIFKPHAPRNVIGSQRGVAAQKLSQPAGIASPLTEGIDANTGQPAREYYETQLKTSSDGLFILPIKPIKTLNLKDALGAEVVIKLAEPKPEPTP